MKSSARLSSRGVRRCADLRDVCIAIAAAARLMADSLDALELDLLDMLGRVSDR
jgi:hypothetical protein